MKIYKEILGNSHDVEWCERLKSAEVEFVELDQWTAQKSRFVVRGDRQTDYAVALSRHTQLLDGDILDYDPHLNRVAVVRLKLSDVLVIDMSHVAKLNPEQIMRTSVELGHAIGNQHWPAVVKQTKVYVPLTVDRKVMLSVMDTHHIEGIEYQFQQGVEVIPYLAPHEIRRLFGGASQQSHSHHQPLDIGGGSPHTYEHEHEHEHEGGCEHDHEHTHSQGDTNNHNHEH